MNIIVWYELNLVSNPIMLIFSTPDHPMASYTTPAAAAAAAPLPEVSDDDFDDEDEDEEEDDEEEDDEALAFPFLTYPWNPKPPNIEAPSATYSSKVESINLKINNWCEYFINLMLMFNSKQKNKTIIIMIIIKIIINDKPSKRSSIWIGPPLERPMCSRIASSRERLKWNPLGRLYSVESCLRWRDEELMKWFQ